MNLQVSSSPHIKEQATTRRLMRDVILALLPALLASVFLFGLRALAVVSITVASCVLIEYLARKIMRRDSTVADLSAVVTGLLLSFSLPPTVPLWICPIGAFVAIGVVKQMFGGIGNNFVNPAVTARIVLHISFPLSMGTWTMVKDPAASLGNIPGSLFGADLISSATPLQTAGKASALLPSYGTLLFGLKSGCIGEVCVIALLLGAVYLVARKVIKLWIPLAYIGTMLLIVAAAGKDPLYHLLSGGLVLGAFFMATDYVTSPITVKGKLLFGIGCGAITALIRLFGGMTEGVSYAILLMNILTPHIDRLTIPVPFGGGKKRAKQNE